MTLAALGVIKAGKDFLTVHPGKENNNQLDKGVEGSSNHVLENDDKIRGVPFESYEKCTIVIVKRGRFVDVVCAGRGEYKYVGPNQRADLVLACSFRCSNIGFSFNWGLFIFFFRLYKIDVWSLSLFSCDMLLYGDSQTFAIRLH